MRCSPNQEAAAELSSKVFLVEPRVNEMEILIDDHAVRMLRTGFSTMKISGASSPPKNCQRS